jgi:hypothetical protein
MRIYDVGVAGIHRLLQTAHVSKPHASSSSSPHGGRPAKCRRRMISTPGDRRADQRRIRRISAGIAACSAMLILVRQRVSVVNIDNG